MKGIFSVAIAVLEHDPSSVVCLEQIDLKDKWRNVENSKQRKQR